MELQAFLMGTRTDHKQGNQCNLIVDISAQKGIYLLGFFHGFLFYLSLI